MTSECRKLRKIEQQGRFNPIVSVLSSNRLLLSSRGKKTIITSLYSFLATVRQSISYLKKIYNYILLFSGYCKPNIIRNFLLSILTLNIFKIYNGAHHEMFLNFRAPNSYKLHAYKNWIINTLIIINVSFLYYEVGFFFFLSFTVCLLLFDFTVLFCL